MDLRPKAQVHPLRVSRLAARGSLTEGQHRRLGMARFFEGILWYPFWRVGLKGKPKENDKFVFFLLKMMEPSRWGFPVGGINPKGVNHFENPMRPF